ncbi:patatin-like phospholipase family protein [Hyalangium gracile]|uniref:patatin-like phospholipase family protein n=1 Tax=Hyalangium gracile TaxID=394092 RepID=UPI001CCAFB8C|nr:patatin-like phospholipase family protein [Hyalangium gracile]
MGKQGEGAGNRKKFRILSLDGGSTSGGMVSILLLKEMMDNHPSLLERADVIVGTSAGAWNALTIAAQPPDQWAKGVERALSALWSNQGTRALTNPHWLRFVLLSKSLYGDNFRHVLEPLVGASTLGGLSKKVLLTAVGLSGPTLFNLRNWNSWEHGDRKALDVALASSAAPLLAPIHDGSADGGLLRNNPSAMALVYLWQLHRKHPDEIPEPEDFVLLSIGNGLVPAGQVVGDHDWGWLQWLRRLRLVHFLYDLNIYPSTEDGMELMKALHPETRSEDLPYLRVNPQAGVNLLEWVMMYGLNFPSFMNRHLQRDAKAYVQGLPGTQGESTRSWQGVLEWLRDHW